MTDMVNHPPHYQTDSGLEAIDVIEAFFRYNYNLGQVFKYIARCGKKNDAIEDLKKARWYLDKEIEWRESDDPDPEVETVFAGTLAEVFRTYIAPPEFEVGDRVVCFGDPAESNINGIGTIVKIDSEDKGRLSVAVQLDNDLNPDWPFWYRPDQLELIDD